MSAARLLLLLLLVLVAVVIVLFVLRRGAARRDAQRVEAAGLRSDADALAATVAGQTAYADQAAQRAEIARVEAEDKAREAARLEEEATEHRATVEATQRDYETTMRRADDIDPDVKESAFAPVADVDDAGAGQGDGDVTDAGDRDAGDSDAGDSGAGDSGAGDTDADERDGETMMTRAARREAREAEQGGDTGSGYSAPSAASSAATAGAAGGAAAGAAAWASHSDEESVDERGDESERIAAAADFRDDVPAEATEPSKADEDATAEVAEQDDPADADDDVYAAPDTGSEADMSDDTRTETSEPAQHDDGLDAGGAAAAASAESGGAYAATRALHEQQDREGTESPEHDADVAHDVESPRGEWGGPHNDAAASHDDAETTDGAGTGRESDTVADDSRADAGSSADADVAAVDGTADAHDTDDADADAGDADRSDDAHDPVDGGMTVITDPESYAATEPVLAEDQTPPVSPLDSDTDTDERSADEPAAEAPDEHEERDDVAAVEERDDRPASGEHVDSDERAHDQGEHGDDHAPAEAGAAVADTHDTDRSAADVAEEPTEERDDPTPTRDWGADEGELLEETHERGERLEEERSELAQRSDDAAGVAAAELADHGDEDTESRDTAAGEQSPGRRISGFDELRDGGFGIGSAAPLDDGAQPLDHPVQAYRDTMTYRVPGDAGYDSAEPHVWFYDEDAAQRSGFRRSEG